MQVFDPESGPDPDQNVASGPSPNPDESGRPPKCRPRSGHKVGRRAKDLDDWRPQFLHFLRAWDGLERAAVRAGVTARTVQRARKKSRKFDERVRTTLELRKQDLDKKVIQRGLKGSDRCLLAAAKAHIPELYGRQGGAVPQNVQPV